MTEAELHIRLAGLSDPTAEAYQNKIISDTRYPMHCIRMPVLRSLAKELAAGQWQTLIDQQGYQSFEHVLVLGLCIAYAKCPFADKTDALRRLLPYMDSWAMTDSIVPTLKPGAGDRELLRSFTLECLEGTGEYTVRFGIVLLLHYFLTPEDIPWTARRLTSIRDDRYYVQMAVAWCFAEMAVHDPRRVMVILQESTLDTFIHNKTIQKIRESYRIPQDIKESAQQLKRKDRI